MSHARLYNALRFCMLHAVRGLPLSSCKLHVRPVNALRFIYTVSASWLTCRRDVGSACRHRSDRIRCHIMLRLLPFSSSCSFLALPLGGDGHMAVAKLPAAETQAGTHHSQQW